MPDKKDKPDMPPPPPSPEEKKPAPPPPPVPGSNPPPPPEPRPQSSGGNLNSGTPAVSAGGTRNVLVLLAILLVGGYMLYTIFTGEEKAPVQTQNQAGLPNPPATTTTDTTTQPSVPSGDGVVAEGGDSIVPPPPPQALEVPPPPPPPPPPALPSLPSTTGVPALPTPGTSGNEASEKKLNIPKPRLESPMLIATGSTVGKILQGGAENAAGAVKPLEKTSAPQVDATKAGDPENLIAQGKIIDAVLETAINTDLSGILRAIVSHDIYAESGKRILVPKGSRLIGSYDTDIKQGQSRVYIIWNRVIRPDGIDLVISSPGSDQLGRAGTEGKVDSKYFEIFGNSILFSTIAVAFAFGAEEVTGAKGLSERESSTGSITTTGKASDVAIAGGVNDIGEVAKNLGTQLLGVKPTITIDQGTRVKVFVNRDVVFPSQLNQDVNIIR